MRVDVLKLDDVEMFEKYLGGWHVYQRTLIKYRNAKYPKRTWATKIVVYWGKTRKGKSRRAYAEAKTYGRIGRLMMPGRKGEKLWADNLIGAEAVIIEDMMPDLIPYNTMLLMTDRYPLELDVKFGSVNFAPKVIFITSNFHPREWYADMEYEGGALEGRMKDFGTITKHTVEWKPKVIVIVPDTESEDEHLDAQQPEKELDRAMREFLEEDEDLDLQLPVNIIGVDTDSDDDLETGRDLVGGGMD